MVEADVVGPFELKKPTVQSATETNGDRVDCANFVEDIIEYRVFHVKQRSNASFRQSYGRWSRGGGGARARGHLLDSVRR